MEGSQGFEVQQVVGLAKIIVDRKGYVWEDASGENECNCGSK